MVTYHHLKTVFDIERVIKFVSRVYVHEGYVKSVEDKSGVSEYLSGPTAATFLAQIENEPVGTISLVGDSQDGLPMDSIYKDVLSTFRNKNAHLAEVCQFAIDTDTLKEKGVTLQNEVSISLLSLVIAQARKMGYTHLTFTINPKHRKLYEMLGALHIGEEKSYPSVNGAPALAYILDMTIFQSSATGNDTKNFLIERISTHVPECSE